MPNRPLTADEAALIALRHQPGVVEAQQAYVAAQGRTQQVRAGLLPTISLSGSYTRTQVLAGQSSQAVVSTGSTTGTTTGTGSTTGTTTGTGSTTGTTTGTGTGTTGGSSSTGTGGSTNTGGATTGNGGTTGNTGTTGTGSSTGGTTTSGGTTSTGSGSTTVTPVSATNVTTSTGEGFLATASLKQLIFDFNHTRDLVRESVALERSAYQTLTSVQTNLVYQVKLDYYIYAQDIGLVDVGQANVKNRQDQLDLARARLNSGLGLPADVASAEASVAQATVALNLAQNNAALARTVLALEMGIDPRTPIQPATTVEPAVTSDDVNAMTVTALRQRPEILMVQAEIDANHYDLNAARTTNAPVISGNVQFQSNGDRFLPGNDTFSVVAAIQFSPFDGGLTAGKVKEARANLASARAALIAEQQQVATDVAQAYLNLRSSEQRITQAQAEVANAQEDVRIAVGSYRAGLGKFQDIITAQTLLVTANSDLVNAQYAIQQARTALQHATGVPLPRP